ncbi:glucose/quinate/shikimate family membrane-bound PQQ-dependent dehydrogenase [Pseudomonas nicosulfuronedens]|uniref:Glucose/quinate/shikimate family membrane-bound PQQ-dependent dehydrogenase n=1 Tax=Pseudomonas nicosulfuronedens TaxID=2571105 RepID=A0A5R9QWG8_9PSED|nr:glucose/quinate/shikimate family membrane-bound PQQ-dependent dehydrogenase [Pseudomonas nicosulfuronedens]MDH1011944.1 glucose/quinate/shikimate family membrane-bound PQQ-dependent dehydrogenase [Pseudomonas nicosulfuronedens]MDH2027986.1 glucose/quinate/shikimate family membrane-bound PQQ-dependent dehydrogenase [Pseudomonas nicosulfuronedens]TLX74501.1 glucose/quinate/shikimate family membrane-bound PQQ-dependent dehydrogenase [Pseudomonas nicosulfuronedens]
MKPVQRPSGASTFILIGLGVIIALLGLALAAGGIRLVSLGGSWYFLIGGLAMAISGLLIALRKPAGAWLFAAFLVATAIWAVADSGLVFWPLFSRLFMFSAIGVAVALVYPLLARSAGREAGRGAYGIAGVLAVLVAIAAGNMFVAHPSVAPTGKGPGLTPVDPAHAQKDWAHYGNTEGGSRFAALDQINRSNVDKLKVAWTYHTGDVALSDGNGAEDQLTPLQVGDKVFICTPHNNLIALDADTGKELWKNEINAQSKVWQRCRGMAYFDATRQIAQPTQPNSSPIIAASVPAGANCQRRLLTNTIDARLIAVDADTGEFCQGFGNNGQVDLKAGLGDVPDSYYQLSSAPLMAGTTVVVGGRVADNVQTDMPGGVIRGFDVITGAMRWAFDPGNPDDKQAPADGKTYVRSTPNSWAPMSYDPAMNTVFLPMGSSSTDIYGVERTKLDHTYGASILAVDATTGAEKWVYQTVHNDLWDFDLPMQPSLVDFPVADGKSVPAVVIGTKAGQIYVLDRATGKPLTEVKDVPVKPGNIPDEPYSPTQPRSVGMPQIGAQTLTESDMWGATPYDQLLCRIDFKKMRYDGLYTAPGTDLSLSFPGSLGGMNWGSLSTDPVHGFIFVNDMRLGLWIQMIPSANKGAAAGGGEALNTGMGAVPLKGTPYAVNKNRFLSVAGIPCQAPPFGTLTAIDLKTRQVAWQVPVGTVEDTGPLGIRMHLPIPIGLPTLGGTLSTQGGLVFIAGTQDFYLRAYDSSNGEEIWKARLPVGSQGGPMTYVSPKTGKQFIVITAGGARQSTDRGDYVMAYALPDQP